MPEAAVHEDRYAVTPEQHVDSHRKPTYTDQSINAEPDASPGAAPI